jgi:two-component system phosphate regulon response regulator PhoB
MTRKKILVIENEFSISELISVNLRHAQFQPICVRNVAEAWNIINDAPPDLVVLGGMPPDKSGIRLLHELRNRKHAEKIPTIVLTTRSDEQDKIHALEIGADDYVTKPFSSAELITRIKAVLRRRAEQLGEDVVMINGLILNLTTHRVIAHTSSNAIQLELGPTEFRLLHFLMTHPERVHSRWQLLTQVWGDGTPALERNVDVYIKRLRAALKPAGAHIMVKTVRGIGYQLAENA